MALSAPLLSRKKVVKVLAETDKGTKVAATQAIYVEDLAINDTSEFIRRLGPGLYRGDIQAGVHGAKSGVCSFTTEMRGTGSGGLELGMAILLQAAGFSKASEVYAITSTHSVDKTLSLDAWEDGVKKGLAGAMAEFTLRGEVGKRALCDFSFSGVWVDPTDEAMPAFAPSTAAPLMVRAGTFTLGGETIKIGSFEITMGAVVVPRPDVNAASGIAHYMITDLQPVFKADPEADLVAGYDYYGLKLARTTAAVSLVLANASDTVTIALPVVQAAELTEGDRDGIQIYDYVGHCLHSSGNDAVTFTVTATS